MPQPAGRQQIVRRPLWAALLLLTLLLQACISDSDDAPAPTATPPPPAATPSVTTSRPPPTLPVPFLTPTATATLPPSPTPPGTPIPTLEPTTVPIDQQEDLPALDLTYAIDATLRDVNSGIVDASSVVTITSREPDLLHRLCFRVAPAFYNSFTLNGLTRDGSPVEPVASDNGTTLEIVLDPPLAPGQATELAFDFTIPIGDTGDGFASISRDGDVLRLGFWYPMLSNDDGYPPLLDPPYTLAADYDVHFTAPAEVVVAASGELTEPPQPVDAGVRYAYRLDNGRDFALMLSTGFQLDERETASGIVVRQYTLDSEYGNSDENRAALRDQVFATAERALDTFAANIGPYSWPSLAIVEGGPGLGGGIEYSALTIISYDSGGLDNLVAHEIAHMWFYAAIGTRTQDDPWVDEGAATFLANGLLAGDYAISQDNGAINYVVPLGSSIYELARFGGSGAWITAVYTQGASFYADTYVAMGDDAFWTAMRDLYDSQRFGIATAWEVLRTFQAHTPVDLGPVYERYFVYGWVGGSGFGTRDPGVVDAVRPG